MNIRNSTIIPIKTPFFRKKLDERHSSITPSARKNERSGRGIPLYEKSSVPENISRIFERCKRIFSGNSTPRNVDHQASEISGLRSIQSSSSKIEMRGSSMTDASREPDLFESFAIANLQNEETDVLPKKGSHFRLIPTNSLTPSSQDSDAENVNMRLDEIQRLKNRADTEAICKILSTDSSEVVRARAIEALAEIRYNDNAVGDFDRSKAAYSAADNDFIKSIKEIQELLSKLEHGDIKDVQSFVKTAITKNPEIKYEWRTLLEKEDTVEILRCIVPHSSTLIDTIRNEIM
jgi:hypothetical protein